MFPKLLLCSLPITYDRELSEKFRKCASLFPGYNTCFLPYQAEYNGAWPAVLHQGD